MLCASTVTGGGFGIVRKETKGIEETLYPRYFSGKHCDAVVGVFIQTCQCCLPC